jgi:DNA-directed RNA polymerase specialized sigma24 family protein
MSDEPSTPQDIDQEKLVRDHIAWMLKLAGRLLGDRALAEDRH